MKNDQDAKFFDKVANVAKKRGKIMNLEFTKTLSRKQVTVNDLLNLKTVVNGLKLEINSSSKLVSPNITKLENGLELIDRRLKIDENRQKKISSVYREAYYVGKSKMIQPCRIKSPQIQSSRSTVISKVSRQDQTSR